MAEPDQPLLKLEPTTKVSAIGATSGPSTSTAAQAIAETSTVLPPPRPMLRAASASWPNAPRRNFLCQPRSRNRSPACRPWPILSDST